MWYQGSVRDRWYNVTKRSCGKHSEEVCFKRRNSSVTVSKSVLRLGIKNCQHAGRDFRVQRHGIRL